MGENLINHVYWDIPNRQLLNLYEQLTALITTQFKMCNNQILHTQKIQFNYVRKSHKPRLSGYTEHQIIKYIQPINKFQ